MKSAEAGYYLYYSNGKAYDPTYIIIQESLDDSEKQIVIFPGRIPLKNFETAKSILLRKILVGLLVKITEAEYYAHQFGLS